MPRLFLLITTLLALTSRAASIEGQIRFTFEDSMVPKNPFKKEFGDMVKAKTKWYVGDFFGQETVFAGIAVTNTASKPMFYQYYVAFSDKNGKLVGTAGQRSFGDAGLKPGAELELGSCLIHLPKGRYKDIVSYQAVIYETDTPSKKKQ